MALISRPQATVVLVLAGLLALPGLTDALSAEPRPAKPIRLDLVALAGVGEPAATDATATLAPGRIRLRTVKGIGPVSAVRILDTVARAAGEDGGAQRGFDSRSALLGVEGVGEGLYESICHHTRVPH